MSTPQSPSDPADQDPTAPSPEPAPSARGDFDYLYRPESKPSAPATPPTPPATPSADASVPTVVQPAAAKSRKGLVIAAAATAAALLFGTVAVTQLLPGTQAAVPAATPAASQAPSAPAAATPTPTETPAPVDPSPATDPTDPTADPTDRDVVLEPVNDPGREPFTETPQVSTDREAAPVDDDQTLPRTPSREPVREGGTVGLYGGTSKERVCDKDQLRDYLMAHPGKAKAWVNAQNSDPNLRWSKGKLKVSQLPAFIDGLTPVIMRVDTRVVNHGYRRPGVPTTFTSVLQARTKALVDEYGVVRARCFCGNPVIGPKPVKGETRYVGKKWKGFDPSTVTTITASAKPLKAIPLVQDNGRVEYVQPGTSKQVPNPNPSTDPTPKPAPKPTPKPAPSSTRVVNDAFSFDRPPGMAVKSNVPGRVEIFAPNGKMINVSVEPAPSPDAVLNGYQNKLAGQCTTVPPRDEIKIGPYQVKRDRWNQPCPVANTIAFTSPKGKTIFVEGTEDAAMQKLIATMTF